MAMVGEGVSLEDQKFDFSPGDNLGRTEGTSTRLLRTPDNRQTSTNRRQATDEIVRVEAQYAAAWENIWWYVRLLWAIMEAILVITALALAAATFSNSTDIISAVNRVEENIVTSDAVRRVIRILDTNIQKQAVVTHDQTCFIIGLHCASLQQSFRSTSQDIPSLLQRCGEMELACVNLVNERIAILEGASDQTETPSGQNCYPSPEGIDGNGEFVTMSMGANDDVDTSLLDVSVCPLPLLLAGASLAETGLLPQALEEPNGQMYEFFPFSFPGGLPASYGSSTATLESTDYSMFVGNPLVGSFYAKPPYPHGPVDTSSTYGVYVAYSYATQRNINFVTLTLGGGGLGFTPESVYPNDGVFFVDTNVRHANPFAEPSANTFGMITLVLQSAAFDGLGNLYTDRELVVLSGKQSVSGWDVSAGFDAVTSLPTLTRDIFLVSTEDPGTTTSLISPAEISPYVEELTGKRYLILAMKDTVATPDPDTLYCSTPLFPPQSCGGFATIDRDSLWSTAPGSAVSRLTPPGENNGLDQTTPGDFRVSRIRSLVVSGPSISQLFSSQDPCYFAHYFISHVLNRSDLVQPDPGYAFDHDVLNANVEMSTLISFHQYENFNLLFQLSAKWLDVGDLLYTTEMENDGFSPPEVPERNHIHRPNLDVTESWKIVTGYAPTSLLQVPAVSDDVANDVTGGQIFYGIDFYTGGIFVIGPIDVLGVTVAARDSGAENGETSPPWRLVYLAWLPYLTLNGIRYDRPSLDDFIPHILPDDVDTDSDGMTDPPPDPPMSNPFDSEFLLPYPGDMKLSHNGEFLFVAATGLGQIVVYQRTGESVVDIKFCAAYQATTAQFNQTRQQTIEHPKEPGIPLYGGPSRLTVDPDDRFLYVTTGGSDVENCLFPAVQDFGGVVMRYSISPGLCNARTLRLDPAFLVTTRDFASHLPSSASATTTTAQFNAVAQAASTRPPIFGDISFA